MIKPLGSLSPGSICLALKVLLPKIKAYGALLADLNLDVQGSLDVRLAVHVPDPKALIEAVQHLLKEIPRLLADMPSVSADIDVGLNAKLTANLQLALALDLALAPITLALAVSGGLEGYTFTGQASQLGSELSPWVTGSDQVNALVLVARTPAAWSALSTLLLTS